MDSHHSHEALVDGLYRQLQEIFERSDQAVYLYLDDVHKVCNKRFADLLGFKSAAEWARSEQPIMQVAAESREALVNAYQDAVERFAGSTVNITWQRKSGGTVDTQVILVPLISEGHPLALHFIRPV